MSDRCAECRTHGKMHLVEVDFAEPFVCAPCLTLSLGSCSGQQILESYPLDLGHRPVKAYLEKTQLNVPVAYSSHCTGDLLQGTFRAEPNIPIEQRLKYVDKCPEPSRCDTEVM